MEFRPFPRCGTAREAPLSPSPVSSVDRALFSGCFPQSQLLIPLFPPPLALDFSSLRSSWEGAALMFIPRPCPAPGRDPCLPHSQQYQLCDSPRLRNAAAIPPPLPLLQGRLFTSCPRRCFMRAQKRFWVVFFPHEDSIPIGRCSQLSSFLISLGAELLSSGSVNKPRASLML